MAWVEQTCTVCFDGACPMGEDLDRLAALARLHVRRADGWRVSGAAAFAAIWRRLPAYAWLGRLASPPPGKWLLEGGYRGFLAVSRDPALRETGFVMRYWARIVGSGSALRCPCAAGSDRRAARDRLRAHRPARHALCRSRTARPGPETRR